MESINRSLQKSSHQTLKCHLMRIKILVMIDSSTDDYKVLISPRVCKETKTIPFSQQNPILEKEFRVETHSNRKCCEFDGGVK